MTLVFTSQNVAVKSQTDVKYELYQNQTQRNVLNGLLNVSYIIYQTDADPVEHSIGTFLETHNDNNNNNNNNLGGGIM